MPRRNGAGFTAVSDGDGLSLFAGLAEVIRCVKEIEAPDGCELSDEVLQVVLSTELEDHVSENFFANMPVETAEEPAEPAEPVKPGESAEPGETEEPRASEKTGGRTDEETSSAASAEPGTGTAAGGIGSVSGGEVTSPQTGDGSILLFFAVLLLLCGAAVICLVVVRRKRTGR